MAKHVAVITRDPERQLEALRSALGLLLEGTRVTLVVLNHEIEDDDALRDNLGFIDEMGGARYSDHPSNVSRHGFRPLRVPEVGPLLGGHDLIIPY